MLVHGVSPVVAPKSGWGDLWLWRLLCSVIAACPCGPPGCIPPSAQWLWVLFCSVVMGLSVRVQELTVGADVSTQADITELKAEIAALKKAQAT